MVEDRIYLKTYLKVSEYYFLRKTINGKILFHRDKRAIKFPAKDLDLFLSYRQTTNKVKLYFVAEAATGLRITNYNLDKIKTIKKAKSVIEQRSSLNFLNLINKHNTNKISFRYCRIIKKVKDVESN
jgi:hypothetical protein